MFTRYVIGALLVMLVSFDTFAAEQINPADYIDRPGVRAYIRRYTAEDMRSWLEATIERGAVFGKFITEKIREYDLPEALIYLPVIESGYNPVAISPSGAAGLWQFMLNSIAPYDMTVDEWIDERRDFWKSTTASLKKLEYNRSQLGDWLLAIGAYNCGLGRMKRAIEESGMNDFWELAEAGYLPKETANYVPKFLAIAFVGDNAEEYGLHLPPLPVWNWRRVKVNAQVNMRILAERSNVPQALLMLGNAELLYDVTPPPGPTYHLKVPDIYTDAIERTLQGDVRTLNRFYVHTISAGDTLYALALHFDVSVDLIRYHNPGVEPRYLQIDTRLLIPTAKDVDPPPKKELPAERPKPSPQELVQ